LSLEGEQADAPRAIDLVRRDFVTCRLDERITEVAPRVAASPYRFAFVVSEGGVLLGRLRRSALEGDQAATAEAVMEPGPSTVRADTKPDELRERLESKKLRFAVLTDPEGRLLGIVCAEDLPD
jgi:CBS domain-containing protein